MSVLRHLPTRFAPLLVGLTGACTPSAVPRQERSPATESPRGDSDVPTAPSPAPPLHGAPTRVAETPPSVASEAAPASGPSLDGSPPEPVTRVAAPQATDADGPAPFVAKPYAECGMPQSLRARGWPRKLAPLTQSDPVPFVPGTVTLAVLPDTQYYAACNSPHFYEQARWVARTAARRNTVAVLQLGDLTEHNTEQEWDYVERSLAPVRQLPILATTGNHDHGDRGTANRRATLFNEVFAELAPATAAVLAESKAVGDRENAYYRLKLPQVTLGVLMLEWSPRDESVAWANRVLSKYEGDRVIFVTHAYLYYDGTRYDFAAKGERQEWNPRAYGTGKSQPDLPASQQNVAKEGAHDGQTLWEALVSQHPGVFLTLSGHVLGDGAGVLSSEGAHGNRVHQVLANYQMLDEGGLGYLRLLELLPDGKTLRMKTYSPSLDRFATGSEQNFELRIEPPLW